MLGRLALQVSQVTLQRADTKPAAEGRRLSSQHQDVEAGVEEGTCAHSTCSTRAKPVPQFQPTMKATADSTVWPCCN